ncbi:hypothetical protein LTS15_007061 [Exophiala xenobiotica]|nr:hypothetical protein LTS15_007061 [Exophiala xenobiotica]
MTSRVKDYQLPSNVYVSNLAAERGSSRLLTKFGKVIQKPFLQSASGVLATAGVEGTGAKSAWAAKFVRDAALSTLRHTSPIMSNIVNGVIDTYFKRNEKEPDNMNYWDPKMKAYQRASQLAI